MKVRDLPATAGVQWVKDAFALYRKAPHIWILVIGGWMGMVFGMVLIPIAGSIAASLLQPVFLAGMMLGARDQEQGTPPQPLMLFSAFKGNVKALVLMGAIELILTGLVTYGVFAMVFGDVTIDPTNQKAAAEIIVKELQGDIGWVYAALAVIMIIKGALWFGVPLIAMSGMPTSHAVRWSVYAALTNIGAMITCAIVLTVIVMALSLPLVFGLSAVLPIILILVMPMIVLVNYCAYRSTFDESKPEPKPE